MGLGDRGAPEGPPRTCHHAVKHWRALGKAGEEVSGRIINTASESGLYGQAGQINYATAKAGIVSMTIVLAREMKKYGVTANVVCPRALDPHDRDGRRRGRVHDRTRVGAREHLAARRVPRERRRGRRVGPGVRRVRNARAPDGRFHAREHARPRRGALDPRRARSARKDELFAGRRSKVPPMGFGQ